MFPGSALQGGSSSSLQGGSTTIQGSSPVLQSGNNAAQVLQPAVSPVGAQFAAPSQAEIAQAAAQRAAVAAEAARVNGIRSNANQAQDSLVAGARQSATDIGNTYDTNTRNFISSLTGSQDDINNNLVNNALNLRRSMATIASGVRTGLRSGGVQLANINALDSGAAEALARAYATMGNQQANDANSQSMTVNNQIQGDQVKLNRSKDDKLAEFSTFRNTEPNRVGQKLGSDLITLQGGTDASAGWGANLGVKDQIINEAIQRLNAIDARTNGALGGIHQLAGDEVAQRAVQQDQAGAIGVSPFAVDAIQTSAPLGQGADISQLPIFTAKKQYA